MDVHLTRWRRLTWPASAPWDGYGVMDERVVDDVSPWKPETRTVTELSAIESAQIVDALGAGHPADPPVRGLEDLLARVEEVYADAMDIAEYVLGAPVEWWDVVDSASGETRFVFWLYGIDCGQIHDPHAVQRVGYMSQGALWCSEHPELWKALARAQVAIRANAPQSQLARTALNAAVRCPACQHVHEIWKTTFDDEIQCDACGTRFDAIAAMKQTL